MPDRLPARPHAWVDTPQQLEPLLEKLAASPLIGVDTESDSFHHYREQVCLIQISTPELDAIVDPLAIQDLSSMRPLFADARREWVMNGADYDIVCLKRDFGIHFGRIFDTVVAAQLLGYQATGLAAMLERHFGLKVSKTLQRDEWFRRPLTADQIDYALTDTRYLIPLRAILKRELEEAGRLSWAEEEFAGLARRQWTREPFTPEDFWRIRGARELSRREQIILRELAVTRDSRAREANRPPFKIVSDAVLLALARQKPRTTGALRRVRGLSPLMVRRLGDGLLQAVARGLEADESTLTAPRSGERRRFDPGASRRLDALKGWRRRKAEELKMDPGVLAPLSALQAVSRANPRTVEEILGLEEVARWRTTAFGQEWIEVMARA
ncbi:MAG TPA: ribonuclease D [Candidatus Polarisedimenticolia bacterium]|nr:ribonuclease D [Candidatus Polarisedimenticolia bacterium]